MAIKTGILFLLFREGLQFRNPLFIFSPNPKRYDSKNAAGKLPGN
jgi:hypothetical protein